MPKKLVKKKIRKPWMPADVSPEFIEDLRMKDFLGKLSEQEIVFAKKLGVHRWDLWSKCKLIAELRINAAGQHHNGIRLAPVFDGRGNIDQQRYNENVIFLIKDYDALKEARG